MNTSKAYAVWIAAAAIAAALAGVYFWVHHDGVVIGRNEVQTKWDARELKLAKDAADLVAANEVKVKKLQETADENERKSKEAFNTLMDHSDRLAASLRNRPNRPSSRSGMPAPTSTCVAATGAQLARPDAEFLVRYAMDAARTRIAAEHCQAAYNNARALINGGSP